MPYKAATMEKSHRYLLSALEASHFGRMEKGGGYPGGMLDFLYEKMGVTDPDKVLHLCSGSIKRGVTVDLRPESGAQFICDARHTPFEDESFHWILADPAPMEPYNTAMYGIPPEQFPTPEELMLEARRLLKPNGLFCVLSILEPYAPHHMAHVGAYAILVGVGYYIRGAFIYRKTGPVNGA